jgi:hypothetical protein
LYENNGNVQLKPPLGFDDEEWEARNWRNVQRLLPPELVGDRPMSICESNLSSAPDMDEIDGEGTASTRSTVVSRLSVSSSLANIFRDNSPAPLAYTYHHHQMQAEALHLHGGSDSGPHLDSMGRPKESDLARSLEETETRSRSGSSGLVSRRESEVPLSPPLFFKDGEKNECIAEPMFRSRSRVNIVHEDYYSGGRESAELELSQKNGLGRDSANDIIMSYCVNEEEDELASFTQELGQDDEFGEDIDRSLVLVGREDDAEVMIRIEWLHEIEEEVQPLELDPFPFVHV